MMKTGIGFTYDSCHSIRNIDVFDIPVEELVLISRGFKRYICILKEHGINTTVDPGSRVHFLLFGNMPWPWQEVFGTSDFDKETAKQLRVLAQKPIGNSDSTITISIQMTQTISQIELLDNRIRLRIGRLKS